MVQQFSKSLGAQTFLHLSDYLHSPCKTNAPQ
jgi:hypothetical protein